MEEAYWNQFLVTGKITDYLTYRQMICRKDGLESEEAREPDYSDGDDSTGIVYR